MPSTCSTTAARRRDDVLEVDEGTFTTSFLGNDDVTIKQTLSTPSDDYSIAKDNTIAPASASNNNPVYISGFVGSPLPAPGAAGGRCQGTGDGAAGSHRTLSRAGNGDAFEMDFAVPIGPSSRIVFGDIDLDETVTVTAFDGTTPVSLADWTETAYTGEQRQTATPRGPTAGPSGP